MKPYMFQTAQKIVAGRHTFEQMADHLHEFAGIKSAFIVTQPIIQKQGFVDHLQSVLQKQGIQVEVSLEINPEPTADNIESVFRHMSQNNFDLIIGIGGGSVLDAAKVLSVMQTNPLTIKEMLGINHVQAAGIPTLLIPTTSGTGSEVTPNAIVTFPEDQLKMGIVSPYLLPRLVILDPVLTLKLPKAITAATGMDAYTHALESFISRKANPFSDMLALESIRKISGSIERAYHDGDDLDARAADPWVRIFRQYYEYVEHIGAAGIYRACPDARRPGFPNAERTGRQSAFGGAHRNGHRLCNRMRQRGRYGRPKGA